MFLLKIQLFRFLPQFNLQAGKSMDFPKPSATKDGRVLCAEDPVRTGAQTDQQKIHLSLSYQFAAAV